MSPFIGFILLSILGCFTTGQELPDDIQKCKAGDTVCMAKVGTNLLKASGNGRQDLGISPYEPLLLENLDLSQGSTSPVNLQLKLRDVSIHGISRIEIENIVGFEKDPETSKFEIYSKAKTLDIFGLYTANGRLLVVPVKGEGNFSMSLKNVKLSVKFKPLLVQKNGKTHLKLDKSKILVEPEEYVCIPPREYNPGIRPSSILGFSGPEYGRAKIHLKRFIADGNPLGDSINDVLNENWAQFWEDISPAINNAMLKIVKDILKEPLENVAYENLFLPD